MITDDLYATLVLATLPAAVAYPLIYGTCTQWWKSWIGRALFIKACGVASLLLVSAAFHVFGPDYWGREAFRATGMVLVAVGVWLAFFAMLRALFQRKPQP